MKADQIRQKYLDFFVGLGHKQIPPAPLVPTDDPTTLFTGSGMQQLVPFLKGEPHSMGKRLVDSQPCFRSEDIEEVGDNRHTTFFEMLGNWSLGDYFKREQLEWFWKFLTQEIGLPKEKLSITVFEGNKDVPKDEESVKIWQSLGVPKEKIHYYPADKNWWSIAGVPENMPPGEIGGPDSEVFFEFAQVKHDPKFGKKCHPNCDCGRFLEIGNSVFMEYEKQKDGSFKPLSAKNVDFGGGLERITAASNDNPDIFTIDLFDSLIKEIEASSDQSYQRPKYQASMRIVADHLRAALFMAAEGIQPSNKTQGYVLRRLIRRAVFKMQQLNIIPLKTIPKIIQTIVNSYSESYLADAQAHQLHPIIGAEAEKFLQALHKGVKEFEKVPPTKINEEFAFRSLATYGLPFEVSQELAKQKGVKLDREIFETEFQKHQQLSRAATTGMFKGGLADKSETTIKLHTATHLLHTALRKVLGEHVQQTGSNITSARLRFDFKHPQALTPQEIKKVESLVNQKIKENLPVTKTIEDKAAALKSGVLAFFREKYPDKVSVYTIGKDPDKGWFSKELCGGPHVSSTGEIGAVRIKKQESIGGGIRRLYAALWN